ncbi:hypothetical protein [Bradyrhizobium sp. STM 3557]|uniref:hypothetical protein n=1 Tax=Bradyrhizobium sp. STM 3557 TaxID=578920 RepID=UPI00388E401E
MRVFVRTTLAALSIAGLAMSFGALSSDQALAQAKQNAPAQAAPPAGQPPQFKQIALTQKQIDDVLASQKEMDAITDKLPDNAPPDAKVTAQLEAVAKKHGFASYDEYNTVIDNISLVMGGIDPQSKKYVGSEAVIKQQIAQVQADKKMKAEDKKEALANLDMALKAKAPEVENKGNIDLVTKNYDKLNAALGEDTN